MSGRLRLTTAEEIERAALELFDLYGFDGVTVDEIAAAAGIARRTLFRYFPSKNDIPFGDMRQIIARLDAWLLEVSDDVPLFDAVAEAIIECHITRTESARAHRKRMKLIHESTSLQAHRALRIAEEHAVIARFAARRLGEPASSLRPQVIAHVAMGVTTATYSLWIADRRSEFNRLLRQAFSTIELGADVVPPAGGAPSSSRLARTQRPR